MVHLPDLCTEVPPSEASSPRTAKQGAELGFSVQMSSFGDLVDLGTCAPRCLLTGQLVRGRQTSVRMVTRPSSLVREFWGGPATLDRAFQKRTPTPVTTRPTLGVS